MAKNIISEGKTTNEAIEKGLKKLNVSKEMVDVKVIESEDKRSFFSILTPRVVKVELTVKENAAYKKANNPKTKEHTEKKEIKVSEQDLNKAKDALEEFLKVFSKTLEKDAKYEIKKGNNEIEVFIDGEEVGFLIGYRGETLYAFQNILSSVANKNTEGRVRVLLDIAGYKERRIKTLEELAEKLAKTVIRTRKSVTLEPMRAI